MTIQDLVLKWNASWKYDLWYRRKYNIRFNSPEHRETNQLDIAFEYREFHLENKEQKKFDQKLINEDYRKENKGAWIKQRDNKDDDDALFDSIDISKME